jgi:hypothetical protein
MPGTYGLNDRLIQAALKSGALAQDRFDEAVRRNVQLIHQAATAAGGVDDTAENEPSPVLAKANHELAYQTALECAVLLKMTTTYSRSLPTSNPQVSSPKLRTWL